MDNQETKRTQQSASVTLRANGAVMTLTATRKPDGSGVTTVTTKSAEGKAERGMTEAHKTFDAAKAHLAKLTDQAQKLGWKRSEFKPVSKPDAFAKLPPPPKAVA